MKLYGCHMYLLCNVYLCCDGMASSNKYVIVLIHYVSVMYELNMCVYCFNS
jgi:hypothetical protein